MLKERMAFKWWNYFFKVNPESQFLRPFLATVHYNCLGLLSSKRPPPCSKKWRQLGRGGFECCASQFIHSRMPLSFSYLLSLILHNSLNSVASCWRQKFKTIAPIVLWILFIGIFLVEHLQNTIHFHFPLISFCSYLKHQIPLCSGQPILQTS